MSEEKEKLEQIIATSESKEIRDEAIKQLEELSQSPDDVTSQLVGLSSLLSNVGTDESEVKKIVDSELKRRKISIQDLDTKLKAIIDGISTTINVTIQSGGKTLTRKMTINDATKRPLIQKVLSDAAARNNVYLYGGAGTGKTFSAETIADALGFDIITINCNQFTSALEIIGGQTIDGYQEGKVIRAFGNLDEEGNPTGRGCVLLLDELPKIDPNTAGLLNAALAKSGEFKKGRPAKLENARGIKVERKEFLLWLLVIHF